MYIYSIFLLIVILSLNPGSSFSASFTLDTDEEIFSQSSQVSEVYDFIIVGAGVGGSVVARRLSECKNLTCKYKVLLLEAGPEAPEECSIPGFQAKCSLNKNITYKYNYKTPTGNEEVKLGKALGGTGAISNMIFNRGSPYDFDTWATYTNDQSWNYTNLIQTFKNTEDYNGDFPYSPNIHGKNGPVHLTSRSVKPGSDYWLAAGKSLGLPHIDPSGPQNVSVNEPVFTKIYGRRQNIYDTYVKYGGYFPKLTIKDDAVVKRIIFDDNTNATGVEYEKSGKRHTASASKEVILTSGAVGNVIILWNSGIGPCNKLQELNIKCVSNLPVGSNLQDHVHVKLNFIITDPSGSHGPNFPNRQQALDELLANGTGFFDSTQGQVGQFFISSRVAISAGFPDYPDLVGLATRQFYGIHQNSQRPSDEQTVNITTFNFVGRPKSAGFIALNPKNISGIPIINPRYFSDKEGHDKRILIEGIRTMQNIFKGYRNVSTFLEKPRNLAQCDKYKFNSDKYWDCYIDNRALSSGEFAGKCKMGHVGDPTAVVDSKLGDWSQESLNFGCVNSTQNCQYQFDCKYSLDCGKGSTRNFG